MPSRRKTDRSAPLHRICRAGLETRSPVESTGLLLNESVLICLEVTFEIHRKMHLSFYESLLRYVEISKLPGTVAAVPLSSSRRHPRTWRHAPSASGGTKAVMEAWSRASTHGLHSLAWKDPITNLTSRFLDFFCQI